MLVSTIISRVRYNVEDVNSDVYPEAEVLAAINAAKDELFAKMLSVSDMWLQKSETISFGATDHEKTLSAHTCGIIRVCSTPSGASEPMSHEVVDFRDQENIISPQQLYLRVGEDNTKIYLGRHTADEALSCTVYYLSDVEDYSTTSASVIFAPVPGPTLLVVKSTNLLLASRDRRNLTWLTREQKLDELFDDVVTKLNRTGPRYVKCIRT